MRPCCSPCSPAPIRATPRRDARTADYVAALDANGLKGARIGVAREKFTGYSVAADAAFERALAVMKDRGAIIVDPADIPNASKYGDAEFDVLLYEFRPTSSATSRRGPPAARPHAERPHRVQSRPRRRRRCRTSARRSSRCRRRRDRSRARAIGRRSRRAATLARAKGLDAAFAKHRVDAIVAPTQGAPALIDLVNGDPGGGSSTSPCAVAGYPAITVPMGYARGLPLGLTFMGRAWSEATLLKLAYAFEQASKVRKAPKFAATAETVMHGERE